jgi:hypothetical protein
LCREDLKDVLVSKDEPVWNVDLPIVASPRGQAPAGESTLLSTGG